MVNILFVCSGNTCRSSMAKGILSAAVTKDPQLINQISIDSAGISAYPDEPASTYSIAVLKEEWNIDISSHRAKVLDENIAIKADIILTMTRMHQYTIINQFPELKSKVFTLKEYVVDIKPINSCEEFQNTFDISDPYGLPKKMYLQCAKDINAAVDKLIIKLNSKILVDPKTQTFFDI